MTGPLTFKISSPNPLLGSQFSPLILDTPPPAPYTCSVKFYTLNGKQRRITRPYRYNIDWDGKSRSMMQSMVKEFLKEFWFNDIVFEEFPVAGTRMTIDLYNDTHKAAVEVQGRQHDEYVKYFHRNKLEFLKQQRRDADKREYCRINDILLIEIRGEDILSKETFKNQGLEL